MIFATAFWKRGQINRADTHQPWIYLHTVASPVGVKALAKMWLEEVFRVHHRGIRHQWVLPEHQVPLLEFPKVDNSFQESFYKSFTLFGVTLIGFLHYGERKARRRDMEVPGLHSTNQSSRFTKTRPSWHVETVLKTKAHCGPSMSFNCLPGVSPRECILPSGQLFQLRSCHCCCWHVGSRPCSWAPLPVWISHWFGLDKQKREKGADSKWVNAKRTQCD